MGSYEIQDVSSDVRDIIALKNDGADSYPFSPLQPCFIEGGAETPVAVH